MTVAVPGIWALILRAVAVLWPQWPAPAAIVPAPFEGAARFVGGGVGGWPYFFVLTLIVGLRVLVRTPPEGLLGRTRGARPALRVHGAVAPAVAADDETPQGLVDGRRPLTP
jgi:hypothetical protein